MAAGEKRSESWVGSSVQSGEDQYPFEASAAVTVMWLKTPVTFYAEARGLTAEYATDKVAAEIRQKVRDFVKLGAI